MRKTVLQPIPAPLISSITLKPGAITKFGKRLKTSGEAASRENYLSKGKKKLNKLSARVSEKN